MIALYDEVELAIDSGLASPVPTLPEWADEDLRRYRTAYAEGRAKARAAAGLPTLGDAVLHTLQGRPRLATAGVKRAGRWR